LSNYEQLLKELNLLREAKNQNLKDHSIKGLTFNSKDVIPGTLFICKGQNFKEIYLQEAVKRGAIAYVSEKEYTSIKGVSVLLVKDIRLAMPHLADYFFNSPSKKLKMIAVGGTKGKTTTTHFVKGIIDTYGIDQGKKPCGMLSSIRTYDGLEDSEAVNTTPEAVELQRHLANAVEAGLDYMVIEVSSQALKYNRVTCLEFDVGIFLNISEDHISPL